MHYGVLLVMQEIPSERHTCYYGKMYVRAWDMCEEDGRKARREPRQKDEIPSSRGAV